MRDDELRPSPEALLAETAKERRGKLKLFLGMAPGVGKTYAMLAEAHQLQAAGQEILIGWVDTHRRPDTEALTKGLDILPRKRIRRGALWVEALDVDEIFRRMPSLVVIDEMPHTNPAGSRHAKRWQDIEEILDMGIDVWSALNIQHLESLNGVVERVTGVAVSETVPDRIFDEAEEVRFIDLPPADLIARLHAGKIYLPSVVERAKDAYFRKSNLIALRELAIRTMASRMESQIRSARRRSTRRSVEDTTFGLLLVLETVNEASVREGARMARALSAPWHVVWMEEVALERSDGQRVEQLLQFAESLGAQCDTLAGDYGREVGRYAREHNLSFVAISAPSRRAASRRKRALLRYAPELNLIRFAAENEEGVGIRQHLRNVFVYFDAGFNGYWQALIYPLLVALLLYPLRHVLDPTNHGMIYLLGVLFCGVRYGSGPAALSAVFSVLFFDLSVIAPIGSFSVNDTQYLITFAVMLIVGLVAGQLVARRQHLAQTANRREYLTRMLFDTVRELSQTLVKEDALHILSGTLRSHLSLESEFWLPEMTDGGDKNETPDGVELEREAVVLKNVDSAIVRWCYVHRRPAGAGTTTLASSPCRYIPLQAGGKVLAILVVAHTDGPMSDDVAMNRLIDTLASLGAQTLLRLEAAGKARQTLISMEAERLRHTLIQSLSHDLRTPVTTLKVASEGLVGKLRSNHPEKALEDAERLLDGMSRMERLVGNLLEMARLQSGEIRLKKCWIPADELFGTSLAEVGGRLRDYQVDVEIEDDCPPVYGDEVLLVRVVTNLLDNAVKYCPPGSRIVLGARRRGDTIAVTVSDNGPGLPAGNAQRLFDPFRRGQKENNVTGVGLGLAICRTIARAHEAEIFATPSSLGGAAFTLTLPYVPLEEMDNEEVILARAQADFDDEDGEAARTVAEDTGTKEKIAAGTYGKESE